MVDAGNALHAHQRSGDGEAQARATARVVAAGLSQTGLDAMALGEQDWWLGAPFVSALVREHHLPVFAANLLCDGERPFPDGVVVERGGLRIGIVGFTAGEPEGCVVEDPIPRVTSAFSQLGAVDIRVLLAPQGERELAGWPTSTADLVVSGDSSIPSETGSAWGDGWVLQSGSRGKQLGITVLSANADAVPRWPNRLVPLAEALAERPDIATLVTEGKARIAAAEAAPDAPVGTTARRVAPPSAYAGRDACTGCHVEADTQWRGTPHAHAWATLDASGRALDRACIGCHVTGWQAPDGPSAPADIGPFRDVQCEACHGPSAAHVASPMTVKPVRSPAVTVCTTCHDEQQTAGRFDVETYWPRIVHGSSAGGAHADEHGSAHEQE